MMKNVLLRSGAGLMLGALALVMLPTNVGLAKEKDKDKDHYKHIFTAHLSGDMEVPPVETEATGHITLGVSKDESELRYHLYLEDAENVTAAHLHCGMTGQNGPVVVPLFATAAMDWDDDSMVGTLDASDVVPNLAACSPGIQTLSHLVQAMREGKIYANVHSTEYPGGLVRGQVMMSNHGMAHPLYGETDMDEDMPVDESHDDDAMHDNDADTDEDNGGVDDGDVISEGDVSGTHLVLSTYYLVPPHDFTITGERFMAGEQVWVTFMGVTHVALADQYGNFEIMDVEVPLSEADSMHEITATGQMSGMMEMATLTVGTYYPVVTPSDWYVEGGDMVTFSGMNFGPNEYVNVSWDDTDMGMVMSSSTGSMNHVMAMPEEAGSYTYWFMGAQSGVEHHVTIHVY